jgi:hypothetical protein
MGFVHVGVVEFMVAFDRRPFVNAFTLNPGEPERPPEVAPGRSGELKDRAPDRDGERPRPATGFSGTLV